MNLRRGAAGHVLAHELHVEPNAGALGGLGELRAANDQDEVRGRDLALLPDHPRRPVVAVDRLGRGEAVQALGIELVHSGIDAAGAQALRQREYPSPKPRRAH